MYNFIENLKERIKNFTRFKGALLSSILLFFIALAEINDANIAEEVLAALFMALAFALVANVLAVIIMEALQTNRVMAGIIETLLYIVTMATYFIWHDASDKTLLVYAFINFFMVASAFFIAAEEDYSEGFSKFCSNYIFSCFVCGIVMGGLSICLAAFDALIAEVESEAYLTLLAFIGCIFFINLVLTAVPSREHYEVSGKIWRIFVQNIMFPIYLVLVGILYLYIFKIILTFDLPSNRINLFVSLATSFYIFFYFALKQYEYDNRLVKLFIKFGGILMLPLLALQAWSVSIRLSAYGLTSARYISLMYNVFAVIFALLATFKREYIRFTVLLSVVFVGIITIPSPVDATQLPANVQLGRLENVIEKHDLLQDGKIVSKEIPKEDEEKLVSAYNYLRYVDQDLWSKKPNYLETKNYAANTGWYYYLNKGGNDYYDYSNNYYERYYYSSDSDDTISIDIAGYSRLEIIDSYYYNSSSKIKNDDLKENYGFDFENYIEELYAKYGDTKYNIEEPLIKEVGNYKFIFTNVSLHKTNGTITDKSASGYVLIK